MLSADAAERVDVLWSVMFVVISVIYRPVEQLLSRTIAERRAHGHTEHPLRVPIAIQAGFALAFLAVALALRTELIENVFDGYSALYYVLLVGTLAYAGSYFARGWLAGHEYFALYGGLVLMEASSRICFALAVALGIASGQTAVALGIAAAPLLSLVVVPAAFARRGRERHEATGPITVDEADAALAGPGTEGVQETAAHGELSLRRGGRFALWVSGIMLSEQTLLNAAVLTVYATSTDQALAGIVFNVMLIARAPLQLFQAIQTSLLPHLTGLEAKEGHAAFARAIRLTVLAIAAFAAAVALGLLLVGPFVMSHLFGQHYAYNRFGLALIGLGMGMHLASGALNQAALARNRARAAATCWMIAAVVFLAWMFTRLSANRCCAPRSATPAPPRCLRCCCGRSTARARRSGPRALSPRRPPARSPGRPRRGRPRRRSPSPRRTRSRRPVCTRARSRGRSPRRPRPPPRRRRSPVRARSSPANGR